MRVVLINMPFASLNLPSFALTQLAAVLREAHGAAVDIETLYVNQELVAEVGIELNQYVVEALEANNTGVGDWLFRQAAFPELPDNEHDYFARYYPGSGEHARHVRRTVKRARERAVEFLEGVIERHQLGEAAVVGMTSMFSQSTACFALARLLKARAPAVVTVMGGANCEGSMGRVIANNVAAIDYVFSGPALKSFPELVGHLRAGEPERCASVRGVMCAGAKNRAADPRELMGEELDIDHPIELDYAPFLAAIDDNFAPGQIRPRINFETSRGCWWGQRAHCTFCGLNGLTMGYRAMRPELARTQLRSLFERYGARVSRFEAVDNILPKNYVAEVFGELEPNEQRSIFYEVKADLRAEELEVLARAGVREVQPGIESLATVTLKLMKKGSSAFTNVVFLKNCLRFGVYPFWNLLVGFPGEPPTVYEKYVAELETLAHLSPPDGVNPVRFDRFSPYFVNAKSYELDLHPYDFYGMTFPFAEPDLRDMAYYFMDHNIEAEYFLNMAQWIDPMRKRVDAWRSRWVGKSHDDVPKLYIEREGGEQYIVDTRFEAKMKLRVSPTRALLFDKLSRPTSLPQLQKAAPELDAAIVAAEVDRMRADKLLFEEGPRFVSLVLESAPVAVSGRTLYGLDI